jgi:uncharacterized protein
MKSFNFEQARQYVTDRLERELSPGLTYHNVAHTRDEVVAAAERLARMEGIKGESLLLLLTAAWFHDIGHIQQAADHEAISVEVAEKVLPSFGYTEDQIKIVSEIIMVTLLPQSPRNRLEEILADADLDMLGRENFMQRNGDLRRELAFLGREYTDEQWIAIQLQFLEGHSYFTASARLLRDAQKAQNIKDLKQILESMATGQ